ncbi:MAG TPA: hypothetical protein PLU39_19080 [Armatimonadota bacterium]|nr:hypothetical protein [Armatimonadota bacterium]HPT99974.1 hypothetical protein [Armatimonadota bacterium]
MTTGVPRVESAADLGDRKRALLLVTEAHIEIGIRVLHPPGVGSAQHHCLNTRNLAYLRGHLPEKLAFWFR